MNIHIADSRGHLTIIGRTSPGIRRPETAKGRTKKCLK